MNEHEHRFFKNSCTWTNINSKKSLIIEHKRTRTLNSKWANIDDVIKHQTRDRILNSLQISNLTRNQGPSTMCSTLFAVFDDLKKLFAFFVVPTVWNLHCTRTRIFSKVSNTNEHEHSFLENIEQERIRTRVSFKQLNTANGNCERTHTLVYFHALSEVPSNEFIFWLL